MATGFDGTDTLDIIRRATQGEAAASNWLIQRTRPTVVRLVTGKLPYPRDLKQTDEIVNEIFLKTIRRMPQLDFPSVNHFFAYLHTACRHAVTQEIRHLKTRPKPGELDPRRPDPASSASVELELREARECAERCVEKMSARKQGLIVARIFAGLTVDEIWILFGYKSSESARVALHNAIGELTDRMAKDRGRPPRKLKAPPDHDD